MIYGADGQGGDISEAITSTSVAIKQKIAASAGPLEPAFAGILRATWIARPRQRHLSKFERTRREAGTNRRDIQC